MSIRALKIAAGVSYALILVQVGWLTESLVAAESTWQPIDVVFAGVEMPLFPPWSSYLGAGVIFWLIYLWQGRR